MPASDDAIHHVTDTALWVAHYRAVESERTDALFRDPYATRLAGERGRRIAEGMGVASRYTQWTVVIRTVLIDQYVKTAIAGGVDTILNLGAGLDSRPYRMELPEPLRWIEVDHAVIIDHKERILGAEKPRCRLERIRLDLADREARRKLFAGIAESSRKVLVITEGVLPYLSETEVSELAEDLRERGTFQLWIAEYFAREAYRFLKARAKRMTKAPFRFFPDDWFAFFRQRGWSPRETRYVGEETLRLARRIPMPWWASVFWLFAGPERYRAFLRMTGFVLFSREDA